MKRTPLTRKTPLRATTTLARSSTLTRSTPVKQRNAKRAKANHARAYGTKRDWIIAQPCAVCGYSAGLCDPAHAKGEGAGRKSGSEFLVPLCGVHPAANGMLVEGCHRESHRIGVQSFEARHGVDLLALAAYYEAVWQSLSSPEPQSRR